MIPEQRDEPSDATRFATRPKQRKREERNATDNTLATLRGKTLAKALLTLAAPTEAQLRAGELLLDCPGDPLATHRVLEEGMWRQWVADDRTLDPETVAEAFAAKERELTNAITIRALIAQAGLSYG